MKILSLFLLDNIFAIRGEKIVEQVPVSSFSRKPAATFRKLQRATENKKSD